MIETTYNDLKHHLLNDLALKSDDIVFLFSGIWGLGKLENNNLNIISDAFKDVLQKGVLIVPTFSYSWNQNLNWNINEINCDEMGSFSKHTIKDPSFIRTNHPNFSVNILKTDYNGSIVDNFIDIENNTFGENSIFGKLYNYSSKKRAFVLLLGGAFDDVLYRSTFIHFAQQKIGVHHRFLKKIYDPSNQNYVEQYSRYLKQSEVLNKKLLNYFNFPINENFTQYGEDLLKEKLLKIKKFKYYPSRIVNIFDSVNLMIQKYKENKFYSISKESIKNG